MLLSLCKNLCRLERNQEREKGVANFEYLKNIILKVEYDPPSSHVVHAICSSPICPAPFTTPSSFSPPSQFLHAEGPERAGLVPVMSELLMLSPQEVSFIQDTLKGESCGNRSNYNSWCTKDIESCV